VKAVREHGDLWGVFEARDVYVDDADRIRDLFLEPAVTDDYEFDPDIEPDVAAARAFVCEEWAVDASEVERGFERIEQSVVQTGLDRWT
jgi:flap endonuclease-1